MNLIRRLVRWWGTTKCVDCESPYPTGEMRKWWDGRRCPKCYQKARDEERRQQEHFLLQEEVAKQRRIILAKKVAEEELDTANYRKKG